MKGIGLMESKDGYINFSEGLHHLRELAQWVDAAFGRASDLAGCLSAVSEEDDLDECHRILTMAAENVKQLHGLKVKALGEVKQISLFHDVLCRRVTSGNLGGRMMSDSKVVELHPFKCAKIESGRKSEKCIKQCASCAIWWLTKEKTT